MLNADPALKAVFGGKKQVSMFEMTKLASKHVKESAFPNISPGSSGNGLPGFFSCPDGRGYDWSGC
jgi:hypothetical protein